MSPTDIVVKYIITELARIGRVGANLVRLVGKQRRSGAVRGKQRVRDGRASRGGAVAAFSTVRLDGRRVDLEIVNGDRAGSVCSLYVP